jgi:hypothetical protein
MRPVQRLAVLVVTAMVPAAVVLAIRSDGSGHAPPAPAPQSVLVGTIALSTQSPAPGTVLVATVTLRADRPLRLEGIRVAVRDAQGRAIDSAGRSYDFPGTGPIELGTAAQTFTFSTRFRTAGTYVYFLEYRSSGAWSVLPPYTSFTVG